MLSKAQIKHISALRTKKYRTEHAQFIVEGKKSIAELLKSKFEVVHIYYTQEYKTLEGLNTVTNKTEVSLSGLSKISLQKNPEGLLAIVNTPVKTNFVWQEKNYIALDSIRDPGNLGTIIRLADWFGANLLCSKDCVELYNPKVIQASMGSIFHIQVHYADLIESLASSKLPKYAAVLNGASAYETEFKKHGILIIGNEANGISKEVLENANHMTTIPNKGQAESLNAAMACGILASCLFR